MPDSKMLNIGCGATYHPDWINLDVSASDPEVLVADISKGLPFTSEFANVCYSSHVLEHLNQTDAQHLIAECYRVLKPGGILRLVVPDLEGLIREYLRILSAVAAGEEALALDYDWIMLELYDQAVRNFRGGEMANFLKNLAESDRDFVRSRIGLEAETFWSPRPALTKTNRILALQTKGRWQKLIKKGREKLAGLLVYLLAGKSAYNSFQKGLFRDSGEVHQWMYDRYSLGRLLQQAGFVKVEICTATDSRIPEYEKYSLDVLNGMARKPDSLYLEASKP